MKEKYGKSAHITPAKTYVGTLERSPEMDGFSPKQDKKTSNNVKISIGAVLTALSSLGIYLATKGKSKKIVTPNVMQKTLANGDKVVIKTCLLLTKDGSFPARRISVYDKTGKIIKEKSKAIKKSINETTGKKYTTIRQGFYENGNYIGRNEINRYYSKDGDLLLKVNKSINDRGYSFVTKQSPVGEYVLEGEKRSLASNKLSFSSLPGT